MKPIFFPGWNSLDSVRAVHSELELGALFGFAALVVLDTAAHLWEPRNAIRARLLEKIGLCFFAAAVLAEMVAYPYGLRNDKLSGDVIQSLSKTAERAAKNAGTAITDSATASTQAEMARGVASDAGAAANTAKIEADKANSLAGDTASQLIAALKQASDMQQALNRLKFPRTLLQAHDLEASLARYKGTQYTIGSVFGDQESEDLLVAIDTVLQVAGWKRISLSQIPFPFKRVAGVLVPITTESGVDVGVEMPSFRTSAPYLEAATALNDGLMAAITPLQDFSASKYGNKVAWKQGESTIVFIDVGKKP